jgi:PAS domain S-box-containing protein
LDNAPRQTSGLKAIDWLKLIQSVPDFVLLVERDGQIVFVNHAGSPEAMHRALSHTVYEFIAGEFLDQVAEKIGRIFDGSPDERIEVRRSDLEFSNQWWSICMSPVYAEDTVVAALFVCRDVSNLQNIRQEQQRSLNVLKEKFWKEVSAHDRAREILIEEIEVRRNVEQSLRASEQRYRTLVNIARNAIFSVSYDGNFQFLNPVAARELGGEPEDFLGKNMVELFPPEVADRQLATVRRVIDSRTGEVKKAKTFVGGRFRWFITSIQPIVNSDNSCNSTLIESTDIDELVLTTQQLQHERNFSASILQTANSLIVCLDSRGCITVFNGECESVTGYKFAEVAGKSWPETFLPVELRHEGLKDFAGWVRDHPNDRYEGPIITKSGEIRTIFWSNSSFILEDTGELMAIAIGADITELKRLRESLHETEARNRAVLEGLPDLVFVIDRQGVVRKYEGGQRSQLLLPADRVVGSNLTEALPPHIAAESIELIGRALDTGIPQQHEYEVATASGNEIFESRLVRYSDEECIGVVRNVTERKRMERQLEEANEKLRVEHEDLLDKNTALRVVLSQIRSEVEEVKSQVHSNVERLILPAISRFAKNASAKDKVYAEVIESLVREISSSFARNLQQNSSRLTPREVEICTMIKSDFQSKEIAANLNLSIRTIEKFRQRIRIKLGIANKDINLATYLKSL